MRILCVSYVYAPSVGGIETMSRDLVEAWRAMGHEVRIVTNTPDPTDRDETVYRRPSLRTLWGLFRWCDGCYMNNISLRYTVPCLLSRRTVITAAKLPDSETLGERRVQTALKRYIYGRCRTVAISSHIARGLPPNSVQIPNCYNDRLFTSSTPWAERSKPLAVLARLVSEKGVDVAIRAMSELAKSERVPRLTVIGSGPEEHALRSLADVLGIGERVDFAGMLQGEDLRVELNRHRILIVPSVYDEPFGIVCLEGMACGCAVVASNAGGLPDAVGDAGVLFERGDPAALAATLVPLLDSVENPFAAAVSKHLERHTATAIANAYLEQLTK